MKAQIRANHNILKMLTWKSLYFMSKGIWSNWECIFEILFSSRKK